MTSLHLLHRPQLLLATLAVAAASAGVCAADPLDCSTAAPPLRDGAVSIDTVVRAVVCQDSATQRRQGLVEQARAAQERAHAQRWPSLSVDAAVDSVRREGTGQTSVVRLSWVLLDFGATDAQIREARRATQAVLDEQRADVLTALAEGVQSFVSAQVAQGRYEAATQNLRTAQDSLAAAQARRGAGAASMAEQLSAQTVVHQARFDLTRAHGELRNTRIALALAMGLRAADLQTAPLATDDVGEAWLHQPVELDALVEEASERHPRVLAARERLEESRARETALQARRWGQVDLDASAGRERTTADARPQGSAAAALRWTLPLADRGERDRSLRDSLAQTRIRQARLDDARRQTELQVRQDGQTLLAERAALREGARVLETARLALQVEAERYRLGAGALRDVLMAQNQLASARHQWVEVRARVQLAAWLLAASTGRLGPLGGPPPARPTP